MGLTTVTVPRVLGGTLIILVDVELPAAPLPGLALIGDRSANTATLSDTRAGIGLLGDVEAGNALLSDQG